MRIILPEENQGPYTGVFVILNAVNLESQVFVIEEVAVETLPMTMKDMGKSIRSVTNTILQKARKVDLNEVMKQAPKMKVRTKSNDPYMMAWPLCLLLMLMSALIGALTVGVMRPAAPQQIITHQAGPVPAQQAAPEMKSRGVPGKASYESLKPKEKKK